MSAQTFTGTLLLKEESGNIVRHDISDLTDDTCSKVLSKELCPLMNDLREQVDGEVDVFDYYVSYGYGVTALRTFSQRYVYESSRIKEGMFGSYQPRHDNGTTSVQLLAVYDADDNVIKDTVAMAILRRHNILRTAGNYPFVGAFYPEFHMQIYGNFFVEVLLIAVSDDVTFNKFKNEATEMKYIQNVFYGYWKRKEFLRGQFGVEVYQKFPHLYNYLPLLAALDCSVGSPYTFTYSMCFPFGLTKSTPPRTEAHLEVLKRYDCVGRQSKESPVIQLSPIQARYVSEIALLEDSFGPLDGFNILEIGKLLAA